MLTPIWLWLAQAYSTKWFKCQYAVYQLTSSPLSTVSSSSTVASKVYWTMPRPLMMISSASHAGCDKLSSMTHRAHTNCTLHSSSPVCQPSVDTPSTAQICYANHVGQEAITNAWLMRSCLKQQKDNICSSAMHARPGVKTRQVDWNCKSWMWRGQTS